MHNQSVLKPKPIYFENDFIYLQFTIEVYGKNWYMDLYHTQTHLVWNSQTQVELKIKTKYKIEKARWLRGSAYLIQIWLTSFHPSHVFQVIYSKFKNICRMSLQSTTVHIFHEKNLPYSLLGSREDFLALP